MRFNAYLYVIIWTIGLGFSLLAIFWPTSDINPTILIKQTLTSYPLIDFDINSIYNTNKTVYGPFFYWDGRDYWDEDYGTKVLTEPQNIYKIFGQYLDYNQYKTYEELLNNGNIIKKNLECEEGFKNCGTIDTLDQQLCLPENISCPLTDIETINSYETLTLEKYYDKGYQIVYADNNKAFAFTNQTDHPIIGRIILNGEDPCANSYEFSWESLDSDENNSTKRCKKKYKGDKHDKTYTEFGKISYYQLYKENIYSSSSFIKNFFKTRHFYLFKNKFIGIDRKCLKESNINDLPDTIDIVDLLNAVKWCALGFGIIDFILICSIIFMDLFYGRYSDEKKTCAMNIPERFYMGVNSCLFVINTISYDYFSDRHINFDCSDEIVNDQILQLNKRMNAMKFATLGYNIVYILFITIAMSRIYFSAIYGENIFKKYLGL